MLKVIPVPEGSIGFDTDTKLTARDAADLRAEGYSFAVRYLTIGPTADAGDLDRAEMLAITGAGLGLMAVQHVRFPGWSPTGALGQEDGQNCVTHALATGLPAEVSIWTDIEGVADGTPVQAVADYINAWYSVVLQPSYLPGMYEGDKCILTSQELYGLLLVQRYWKSASDVPAVDNRGYCMIQTLRPKFRLSSGVYLDIDHNVVLQDGFGGLPMAVVDDTAWQGTPSRQAVTDVQAGIDSVIGQLTTLKAKIGGLYALPLRPATV